MDTESITGIVDIAGATDIAGRMDDADTADSADAADFVDAADRAARARRARFGKLPEHIPYAALVEETVATPKALDGYSEERSWLHYSCVALDLGF